MEVIHSIKSATRESPHQAGAMKTALEPAAAAIIKPLSEFKPVNKCQKTEIVTVCCVIDPGRFYIHRQPEIENLKMLRQQLSKVVDS